MSNDITLTELLQEDIDFVVFDQGEIESTHSTYGDALNEVLESSQKSVGVVQMGRPVYLDPDGVIQTLLSTALESYDVDIRFTSEGISASAYDSDGKVVEESWFTWDEVEEMKSDEESHITFELGHD